jgi:Raf kinase inhibitor-like YbhB/YbcL family protein
MAAISLANCSLLEHHGGVGHGPVGGQTAKTAIPAVDITITAIMTTRILTAICIPVKLPDREKKVLVYNRIKIPSHHYYYPQRPFPGMYNRWLMISTAILITIVITAGCTSPAPRFISGQPAVSPSAVQPGSQQQSAVSPETLVLSVDSLTPDSVLPDVYTCKGTSESPKVSWDGIPAGTKNLVLILDDPDAPAGTFTHWIVYNIPPKTGELMGAQPNAKVLANGAQQGDTSAGSRGYYPPCPPVGTTHRYVFRLYAVDMDITQPTADRDSIDWALTGHTIGQTEFTTHFKR